MYFDLHLHPALKSFLTDSRPEKRDDCWTTYRNFIDFLVGNIIDSQASLEQLHESQTTISVAAIYALEDGLDDISLVRNVLPLITHLNRGMVKELRPADYFDRFLDKVKHLEASLALRGEASAFTIASRAADISPLRNTLLLAVEGAHILEGSPESDPLSRLEELKNFRHKIFYLTLCHFVRNPFCTQAFAMKLVDVRKKPIFLPQGNGLTELGKALIQRAYQAENGRRILIDIKHMSLSGRQDFYAFKGADPLMKDQPIIASHVAVTGTSWAYSARCQSFRKAKYLEEIDQWAIEYTKPAGLRLGKEQTTFNPATINLFDEDIREIISSGGLIGLMLDQRQLGVNKKVAEYFAGEDFRGQCGADDAPEEWSAPSELQEIMADTSEGAFVRRQQVNAYRDLFNVKNPFAGASLSGLRKMFSGTPDPEAAKASGVRAVHQAPPLNQKKRRHLLHLVNNLLHLVRVGGPAAWRQICLGSDFDGLLDAVNNCENVTEYPDLEIHLCEMIQQLIDQEGEAFRAAHYLDDLPALIRGVMWENGLRFVREHF